MPTWMGVKKKRKIHELVKMFGASDGVWVSGGSFSLRCAALTNRLHWSCEMGHFERQNKKAKEKTGQFSNCFDDKTA